jgi:cell division septation protein DedD
MVGVPTVRAVRIVAVAVGAAALVVCSGTSSASPKRVGQTCGGLPAYITGPEVVFGRPTTLAAAQKLQAQVTAQGFTFTAIEVGCNEFRVVIRGYDTFATAVAIQDEARRSTFRPTVECYHAPDKNGELEVAMGHAPDLDSAKALVALVASRGFVGAQLEADPCGGYEVMMKGFVDAAQANAFAAEAYGVGFNAHLEPES